MAAVLLLNKFLSRETSVNVTRKPSDEEPLAKVKGSLSTWKKSPATELFDSADKIKGCVKAGMTEYGNAFLPMQEFL